MSVSTNSLIIRGPSVTIIAGPVAPDEDGVITRTLSEPGEIVLEDAAVLSGMIGQYASGDALDPPADHRYAWELCADGSATVKHLDEGVPVGQRITTHTGADVVVGGASVRLFFRHTGSAWSWMLCP